MKQKLFLSFVFACTLAIGTKAQINKGAIWLGGSIGYNHNEDNYTGSTVKYKYKELSVIPVVGKVIKNNLVVGVGFAYLKGKHENWFPLYNKTTRIGAHVFARRYFPVIDRLYLFGEAGASLRRYNGEAMESFTIPGGVIYGNTKTKGWEGGIGVTPGASYGITKNIHVETGLNSLIGVSFMQTKTTSSVKTFERKSGEVSAGLNAEPKSSFYIGFRFLLNNKG